MHHVFVIADRELAPHDPRLERVWYRDPHRLILESKAFKADAQATTRLQEYFGLDPEGEAIGPYKLSFHNLLPPQATLDPWDALAAHHCAKIFAYWVYSNRKDSRLILLGSHVNTAFATLGIPWGTPGTACGLPAMPLPHPNDNSRFMRDLQVHRHLCRRWVQAFTGQMTDPEAFAATSHKVTEPPHDE